MLVAAIPKTSSSLFWHPDCEHSRSIPLFTHSLIVNANQDSARTQLTRQSQLSPSCAVSWVRLSAGGLGIGIGSGYGFGFGIGMGCLELQTGQKAGEPGWVQLPDCSNCQATGHARLPHTNLQLNRTLGLHAPRLQDYRTHSTEATTIASVNAQKTALT